MATLANASAFKCTLKLPKSTEWAEADYLQAAVVPAILQASSVEEKNSYLCNGVYIRCIG